MRNIRLSDGRHNIQAVILFIVKTEEKTIQNPLTVVGNQSPMKYSQTDRGIRIQMETDDDIWHIYNILEVGDLVTASTLRRDSSVTDKIRAERAEKKRMTLGIRVEKIEFSEDDLRLKVLGVIESGPQDIGQHHTLMIEVGDAPIVDKRHWKETQLERLKEPRRTPTSPG